MTALSLQWFMCFMCFVCFLCVYYVCMGQVPEIKLMYVCMYVTGTAAAKMLSSGAVRSATSNALILFRACASTVVAAALLCDHLTRLPSVLTLLLLPLLLLLLMMMMTTVTSSWRHRAMTSGNEKLLSKSLAVWLQHVGLDVYVGNRV